MSNKERLTHLLGQKDWAELVSAQFTRPILAAIQRNRFEARFLIWRSALRLGDTPKTREFYTRTHCRWRSR